MIQRYCSWAGRRLSDVRRLKTPEDIMKYKDLLLNQSLWSAEPPSSMIAAVSNLAEMGISIPGLEDSLLPSVATVFPTLTRSEVSQLSLSLAKLRIKVPLECRSAVEGVLEGFNVNDFVQVVVALEVESLTEGHFERIRRNQSLLSFYSCKTLFSFLIDSSSSDKTFLADVVCPQAALLISSSGSLSLNDADLFLRRMSSASLHCNLLRTVVINNVHLQLPRLSFCQLVQVLEMLTSGTRHQHPMLVVKDALCRAEALIDKGANVGDIFRLLRVPHKLSTKIAAFKVLNQLTVADMDTEDVLTLLGHIADAVSNDGKVSGELVQCVYARIFLDVRVLSPERCCEVLEAIAVIALTSDDFPRSLILKLKRRFFSSFRESYGSGTVCNGEPLEILIRFVENCHSDFGSVQARYDAVELVSLQRDCMHCSWRENGTLLQAATELLRSVKALHDPFAVA